MCIANESVDEAAIGFIYPAAGGERLGCVEKTTKVEERPIQRPAQLAIFSFRGADPGHCKIDQEPDEGRIVELAFDPHPDGVWPAHAAP